MATRGGFRYWRDPVCVASAAAYVLNRFWWKGAVADPGSFVHCQLGDVLCVPVCLPVALWLQRRLGLRASDAPPSVAEVLWHWLFWSWCFEWLGPRLPLLAPGAVADPWDVVAYGSGAALAAVAWRSPLRGAPAPRPHAALPRAAVALGIALAVLGSYAAAAAMRSALGPLS